MDWKIHYGDGSTFSSDDGRPEDAPPLNLQIVAQRDDQCGRTLMSGKDYYVYKDGEWCGMDLFGVLDHFLSIGLIKAGRTLSSKAFRELYKQAMADPDLPKKSARWDATELDRPNL